MSTVLTIDASVAGLLIGRGGCNIQYIETYTGTRVRVVDGDTYDTCRVFVWGDEVRQISACAMIAMIITNNVLNIETRFPRQPRAQPRQRLWRPIRPLQPWPPALPLQSAEDEMVNGDLVIREPFPAIVKDVYVEHDDVKAMSVDHVNEFRLVKNQMTVRYLDENAGDMYIPKPVETFEHAFHAYRNIMDVINKQNFEHPSAIQCQGWPIIMSGHDLVAVTNSTLGKTLAYALPAIIHLNSQPTQRGKRDGPSVVILGPTREVVLQIEKDINKYVHGEIGVLSVCDGRSLSESEMADLLIGQYDIVVATPNELNTMVTQEAVNLRHVSYLVLDEVNRMLGMEFIIQITKGLEYVHPDRQTIIITEKWTNSVQYLTERFTIDPILVTIGMLNLADVKATEQSVVILKQHMKIKYLEELMEKTLTEQDKIIIYVHGNKTAQKLYGMFVHLQIKCQYIHKNQQQRYQNESLSMFRSGAVSVLIVTDAVTRSLHVNNSTLLINYDFPLKIRDYIHRIRGKSTGGGANERFSVLSFVTSKDISMVYYLIDVLEISKQPVPNELYNMINQPTL